MGRLLVIVFALFQGKGWILLLWDKYRSVSVFLYTSYDAHGNFLNSLFSWRLCEASLEAKRKSEANTGRPLIQARKESLNALLFWLN